MGSAYDDILQWSRHQPIWQRDALRRICTSSDLSSSDLSDLTDICKSVHGLTESVKGEPVESAHLPSPATASAPVTLLSVTHLNGVNALASDQTVSFGPQLTVVFGHNAAGKSGYTRILKKACRSRSPEGILGNVLVATKPLKPQAIIRYRDGSDERTVSWEADKPSDAALGVVSVFDSHSAAVYVRDKTDVAFRPFGLDVLDKLARAADSIRRRLESERSLLASTGSLLFQGLPDGTRARKAVENITSLTNVDYIRKVGTLDKDEEERLTALRRQAEDAKSKDSSRQARELRLKADRFDSVANHIGHIASLYSSQSLANIRDTADALTSAQAAAKTLRETILSPAALEGTGGEKWRLMWDAASAFGIDVLAKGELFAEGSTCPLCQQRVGADAADRLRHFAEYVASTAESDVARLNSDLQNKMRDPLAIEIARPDLENAIAELDEEDRQSADSIREFVHASETRQRSLESAPTTGEWPEQGVTDLVSKTLRQKAKLLRQRAQEMSAAAASFDDASQSELRELEARVILRGLLPAVESEIERKKKLAAYGQCIQDTQTQSITRKNTELTKTLVTDQLSDAFQRELRDLEFTHLSVQVQPAGGAKAEMFHRLSFAQAPGLAVSSVLSEGESRTLSLAAFLTELSTASTSSAIIFDDPVSSLDHIWRERIAKRLTEEARRRQTIVFTHDLLFLRLLREGAEREGIDCHHQFVRRRGATDAGVASPDLPWVALKTKDRLGVLRQRWQALDKVHRTGEPDAYEREVRDLFGLLRESWEQAVTEVLLYDVVEPYRPSVETRKVRFLHDITEADCNTVEQEMSTCSRWIRGHVEAAADGTPLPTPDETKQRIDSLNAWVEAIRRRRK